MMAWSLIIGAASGATWGSIFWGGFGRAFGAAFGTILGQQLGPIIVKYLSTTDCYSPLTCLLSGT
jgi:hypothetical protein